MTRVPIPMLPRLEELYHLHRLDPGAATAWLPERWSRLARRLRHEKGR